MLAPHRFYCDFHVHVDGIELVNGLPCWCSLHSPLTAWAMMRSRQTATPAGCQPSKRIELKVNMEMLMSDTVDLQPALARLAFNGFEVSLFSLASACWAQPSTNNEAVATITIVFILFVGVQSYIGLLLSHRQLPQSNLKHPEPDNIDDTRQQLRVVWYSYVNANSL